MIIGHAGVAGFLYCTGCWSKQVEAGSRPDAVLTDDREEPGDNFWIVDNCEACGQPPKYMTVRMLD